MKGDCVMKKIKEFEKYPENDWYYNQSYPGVVVTDISMDFRSMVIFMVKWAIAAIPAFIILGAIFFLLILGFSLIIGGVAIL